MLFLIIDVRKKLLEVNILFSSLCHLQKYSRFEKIKNKINFLKSLAFPKCGTLLVENSDALLLVEFALLLVI